MPRSLIVVTCLLLIGVALPGCDPADAPTDTSERDPATQTKTGDHAAAEHPAPPADWSVPMIDTEGLRELKQEAAEADRVLVLDFWATWCGSCVQMFPRLHEALADRDGVRLVSMCHDEGDDYIDKAEAFLVKRHAWDSAYLVDPAAKESMPGVLSEQWDGVTLPAVFVIGKDGELRYEMLQTRGEVDAWVDGILAAVDEAAGA